MFFLAVLGVEARTLCKVSKYSTLEPQPLAVQVNNQNTYFVLFCLRAEALSRNLAQHLWKLGGGELHRVKSLKQALFTAAKWLAGGRFYTNKEC